MNRRAFLYGLAASAVLSLVPTRSRAAEITPEEALRGIAIRFPVLSGMRITYSDHPGLALWPGKTNGIPDYRTVELWTGYLYAQYPDSLHHECGHALDYWAGVARNEPARFIDSALGEIVWDSVLSDFWKVRGFSGSPFPTYVDEEVYRRQLQASGDTSHYYAFTPGEQFANCFAAVTRGLGDESQLGLFRTENWGIPMNSAALAEFFASAAGSRAPLPPTAEFGADDYRGMSRDGSMTVWYSKSRGRDIFFVSGAEVVY